MLVAKDCLAVADAIIVYKEGESGRLDIFTELGMQDGVWTRQCFVSPDKKRLAAAQIQALDAMQFARQRRTQVAVEQEGDIEEYYLVGGHE